MPHLNPDLIDAVASWAIYTLGLVGLLGCLHQAMRALANTGPRLVGSPASQGSQAHRGAAAPAGHPMALPRRPGPVARPGYFPVSLN